MKKLLLLSIMCLCLSNCAVGEWYMSELDYYKQERVAKKDKWDAMKIEQPEYYSLLKAKKWSTGMPEEYIELSRGEPERLNQNCSSKGCFNQYVYYDELVYANRGKITSWSTR